MSTLVFVHGVSVRDPEYADALPWLRAGMHRIRPEMQVDFCFWGKPHGATLHADGASVPSKPRKGKQARPIEGFDPADVWTVLERDPTIELRVLAASVAKPGQVPLGAPSPRDELLAAALRLVRPADGSPLADALREQGLGADFGPAVRVVLDSADARAALLATAELGADLRLALSRAFIAMTLWRAGRDTPPPLTGIAVDRLVDLIVDQLAGVELAGFSRRLIERGVVSYAERHRDRLTQGIVPWAGDVATYLARGDAVRATVAAHIAAADPPVYLLGHSLGGVACVDLLVADRPPAVELLITVGSQAPYLYELDALPSLRFGEPLPPHFPHWVNVYDPRDLLAFVGQHPALFQGSVADRPVDSGAPFPRAHGAYFRHDDFYTLLHEVLP